MADPIEGETVATRIAAEKLSRMLGCQGAHRQGDAWGPCESQEALMVLIRRGAKGYRNWQKRQKKSACCEGCESKRERVGVHEKARDHDGENKFRTFVDAEERAARLGCEGAHRTPDGMWGPCATAEEYNSIKGSAGFRRMMIDTPTMAKRRRRRVLSKPQRGEWQTLIERGPLGIETIPGGGLVSGKGLGRRRRRVGRLLGGIGRGFRRVPKVVPYNHDAVDGDGDGVLQEGTIWQRPAGTSFDIPHGTRRRPPGLKPTGEGLSVSRVSTDGDALRLPGLPPKRKRNEHPTKYWFNEFRKKRPEGRINLEELRKREAKPGPKAATRQKIINDMEAALDGILSTQNEFQMESLIMSLRAYEDAGDFSEFLSEWNRIGKDQERRQTLLREFLFTGEEGAGDIPNVVYQEFITMVDGVYREEKMRNAVAAVGRKNFLLTDGFKFGVKEPPGVNGRNVAVSGIEGAHVGLGEVSLESYVNQALRGNRTVGWYNVDNGADGVIKHEFGHHFDHVMNDADPELRKLWHTIFGLIRARAYRDAGQHEYFHPDHAKKIVDGEIAADEVGSRVLPVLFAAVENMGGESAEDFGRIVGHLMPSVYGFSEPKELFAEMFALTTSAGWPWPGEPIVGQNWREAAQFMDTLHGHLAAGGGLDTLMEALEREGLTKERLDDKLSVLLKDIPASEGLESADRPRPVVPTGPTVGTGGFPPESRTKKKGHNDGIG